jgi:hypothetical protein
VQTDHCAPVRIKANGSVGNMERETGIEPATSSLGSWRSTAELLPLSQKTKLSLPPREGGTQLVPPTFSFVDLRVLRGSRLLLCDR